MREIHIIICLLEKRSEKMSVEIKRTHDEFYASESHKDNVKESFKYIANVVLESWGGVILKSLHLKISLKVF